MSEFLNRFTNDEAMLVIKSLIELTEKYETTLQIIAGEKTCPAKIKNLAQKAIDYGNELVDGVPN